MANEEKKDFNAMLLRDNGMPKIQIVTDEATIKGYGGNRMYSCSAQGIRRADEAGAARQGHHGGRDAGISGKAKRRGLYRSDHRRDLRLDCRRASHQRTENLTPYWRTLKAGGELNPKYPGGIEAQRQKLEAEGHTVLQKGREKHHLFCQGLSRGPVFPGLNLHANGSGFSKLEKPLPFFAMLQNCTFSVPQMRLWGGKIRAEQEKEDFIMTSNIILQARGLKKYYGSGETQVRALDGVNLDIERGKFTAIIGTSGSGKSTLLNMLGGLDTPTEGSIQVGGTELANLSSEQATIFRRKQIGFIFQNYNLVPVLSVWENIIFPISLDGRKPDKTFIMQIVSLLGLQKKLDSLPNNLSGGQQQRVAIARALASKPSIILADEPTGNLDSKTSDDVIGLLKMTSQQFHQTIVMITHNPEIAAQADRVIRIEDGQIVAD